jgi:hypothetical protein
MFETRSERLASGKVFARRLAKGALLGFVFVAVSLVIGMAGYMGFEGLGWVDAFLNASMLLSGMGPIHNPESTAGKIFAGLYAIFCGFAVLGMAAIVFAPVVHRVLHRFHIEEVANKE